MKAKKFFIKHREDIQSYLLLAIPLIWWGIFFLAAFVQVFAYSFTDWSLSETITFVGIRNYIDAFREERVLKGFVNTLEWTGIMLVGVNFFGLLTAWLISKIKNGKVAKVVLILLFWPTLVSAAASAEVQKFLLDDSANGLFNWILLNANIIDEPIAWLTDPNISLFGLMIYPFFLGFGTKMIIFYAGITSIPHTYYEAAKLETESNWAVFSRITFPLLAPVLLLNVILSLIDGFKIMAPMQLINNGGTLYSTMSVMLALYNIGFEENQMGFASAIGIILFAIVLVVTLIQFAVSKKEETYE